MSLSDHQYITDNESSVQKSVVRAEKSPVVYLVVYEDLETNVNYLRMITKYIHFQCSPQMFIPSANI